MKNPVNHLFFPYKKGDRKNQITRINLKKPPGTRRPAPGGYDAKNVL
jgi:hypothetical protein